MKYLLAKETRCILIIWLLLITTLILMQGCSSNKHHVITEDGVNWYSTEPIDEPEYIE